MSKYWFPVISHDEIIEALSGWGLSVSHEQLMRPTTEFVTSIYVSCLEQITSISSEAINEPLQAALASLEDPIPDLYAASLAHNLILYHITRFATASRIPNFSARDLYMPQPDRTQAILSAFVNFVKFVEQCSPLVSGVQERSTELYRDHESVSAEFNEIQDKLSALQAERAQDQPRCKELQEENVAITAQLIATRDIQTALVKDIEGFKVEKATVLQTKENLNRDLALASDAITRTRSRIVQSPERIKRNIHSMSATAAEEKRTVATNEAKARDLQTKINTLLGIEKDIRACIEQVQVVEKEMSTLEASEKELADLKDHLDERKVESSELVIKQERVRKQLSNAMDKLERAQRHAEDKRIANQDTIDRLQREYEEMSLERRQNDKELEEVKAEANEAAVKMAEHLKKSESELNELLNEYWYLRHQTEVYMETLANKLGMHVSTSQAQ